MAKNRKHEPKSIPVRIGTPGNGSNVSRPINQQSVYHFTLVSIDASVLQQLRADDVVFLDLTAVPPFAETCYHLRIGNIRAENVSMLRRLGCHNARIVEATLSPEPFCELEVGGR